VNALRVIKTALALTIVGFAAAGSYVSIAVMDRQKALQQVARYNMVWAVSQSIGEFYRFEARLGAFEVQGSGVDKDEILLRFDILNNRLGVFRTGEIKDFADMKPEIGETVEGYAKLLADLDPLVQAVEKPGNVERILAMLQPFETRLSRFAAAANAYGGEQVSGDQQHLLRLHWTFSAIAIGLVACGLMFIILLFFQNRLLAKAGNNLRVLADDLQVAKNEAEAASEAKSRFLANMSHELRTPLNAVIGFSEIIAEETFGPVGQPAYREYAGDINRSGQHMLELINDILTMAKLDAGRYELALSPIDIRGAVDMTIAMFRGSKQAEGRAITIGADCVWPYIQADERAFRQMLLNLMSNAAKFSDPQTPIDVRCDIADAGDIVVTVVDHGIGMTPDELAKVVRPFYQADSRLARKYDGTGLGLSIVAGMMNCHGGRLQIESESGVGSLVSLVFPGSLLLEAKPELAAVA